MERRLSRRRAPDEFIHPSLYPSFIIFYSLCISRSHHRRAPDESIHHSLYIFHSLCIFRSHRRRAPDESIHHSFDIFRSFIMYLSITGEAEAAQRAGPFTHYISFIHYVCFDHRRSRSFSTRRAFHSLYIFHSLCIFRSQAKQKLLNAPGELEMLRTAIRLIDQREIRSLFLEHAPDLFLARAPPYASSTNVCCSYS